VHIRTQNETILIHFPWIVGHEPHSGRKSVLRYDVSLYIRRFNVIIRIWRQTALQCCLRILLNRSVGLLTRDLLPRAIPFRYRLRCWYFGRQRHVIILSYFLLALVLIVFFFLNRP